MTLHAYFNADQASCPDARKSTGGFHIFIGPNIIFWSAQKQSIVSRSSTKAEFIIGLLSLLLHNLFGFNHYFKNQLFFFHIARFTLVTILAILVFHARTKHIRIGFHFVQDNVAFGSLEVWFLSTKDQLVEIFTKPLSATRLGLVRSNLNVHTFPLIFRSDKDSSTAFE